MEFFESVRKRGAFSLLLALFLSSKKKSCDCITRRDSCASLNEKHKKSDLYATTTVAADITTIAINKFLSTIIFFSLCVLDLLVKYHIFT